MIIALLVSALQVAPRPEDPASPLHPRRFGHPGGIGETRGWYFWRGYDAAKGTAEVEHESSRERFSVRVLPWATSYRHLAYPGRPDELLQGERVNLFFNPEGAVRRAWLVHFQDEIGQMQGHGHFWEVEEIEGLRFRARGMSAEKPLDEKASTFELDAACGLPEDGLRKGDRVYLRWRLEGERRLVSTLVTREGLPALKAAAEKRVAERVAREGLGALVDGPQRLLVFPGDWSAAKALKAGLEIRIDGAAARVASAKNLGAYGSGATEVVVESPSPLSEGRLVRVFLP